jgi:ABC-2 type transport system permease protein
VQEAPVSRRRIGALARRIVTQFRRDRRTVALILIVPIVVISLVGYLIDIKPADTPVGVVNDDAGVVSMVSIADLIIHAIDEESDLKLTELSREDAERQLKDGKINAALVFPADFTRNLITASEPTVTLLLEGSDAQVMAHVRDTLTLAIQQTLAGVPGVEGRLIQVEPSFLYGGEDYTTMDYLGPAFIVLMPWFFVFLLTSVSFVRERVQGTVERLLASPLSRFEIVLGYMVGFGIFSLIQSLEILLFTVYVLDVNCEGSIFLAILTVVVVIMTAVNLGILLSTFARNEFQAIQFVPLVVFPQALLGGLFWSLDSLPWFLRWLSYLMPVTYANSAVRDVMIRGASLPDWSVASNLLILAGFAVAFVLLASLTLKREVA